MPLLEQGVSAACVCVFILFWRDAQTATGSYRLMKRRGRSTNHNGHVVEAHKNYKTYKKGLGKPNCIKYHKWLFVQLHSPNPRDRKNQWLLFTNRLFRSQYNRNARTSARSRFIWQRRRKEQAQVLGPYLVNFRRK